MHYYFGNCLGIFGYGFDLFLASQKHEDMVTGLNQKWLDNDQLRWYGKNKLLGRCFFVNLK